MNPEIDQAFPLHVDNPQTIEPIAIVHWLREKQLLGLPYYLHAYEGCAEIGWGTKEHVSFLDGDTAEAGDWASTIKRIGDLAAAANSKAFGYLGFDAWDSLQGFAPDKSAVFPLGQFFIPKHRLSIREGQIDYFGNDHTIVECVRQTPPFSPSPAPAESCPDVEFSEQDFIQAVERAKQSLPGKITKAVLSRYQGFDYDADLLELFARYCLPQKNIDAILMDFGGVGAVIATPELMLKTDAGKITASPLAGTNSCGSNVEANLKKRQSLLNDRKELAEHTLALLQMLDELRPYCAPGTLVVSRLLDIVQQNNLMHLSSELSGQLGADKHCIDAMLSLFPSAMVSGVPKAESIRLIRRLEGFPRGLFGGTIGWVSGHDCRFALTIRGIYKYGARLFVQAGAGILEESDPLRENAEVNLKMCAMLDALSGNSHSVRPARNACL